jgi:Rrf2 family iron-sulfur cluster assembly transcriptional regulator
MKLSTRGRYGTRLMLELTRSYGKGPVSMSEIARRQDIPLKYLEQLVIPLKKARLIDSVRGPKGGHMLSRPPAEIDLWELLNLLESKFTLVDCVGEDVDGCEHIVDCPLRLVWGKAYETLMQQFQETTLNDVLKLSADRTDKDVSGLPLL